MIQLVLNAETSTRNRRISQPLCPDALRNRSSRTIGGAVKIAGMTKQLITALAFAADKHKNQRRKDADASPYINHPIALANLLLNEAGVEDQRVLIAAILHDTIEDTDTTEQELVKHFGKDVADIVLEVTDDKTLPKAERKRLQIEHAAHISRRAKLVKLADKICNLRDITASPPADWSVDRKREYFEWAKSVVDELRGVHPGLEHLFDKAYEGRP